MKQMVKQFFKWSFVVAVWGVIALALTVFIYAYNLPDIHQAMKIDRRPTMTVLDSTGGVIARYGQSQGHILQVQDLPPHLIQAVLATEDRRFYEHLGIDPISVVRAMFVNAAAGEIVQGGSTITQQLAKNLFLTSERTLRRKIEEMLVSFWLEAKYTKNEILGAYLNRVYLGSGNYGVEAAAQSYFNKSARTLTLQESALIAGLLKAPSRYSPKNNPKLAKQRAQTVLQLMQDAGYITSAKSVKTPDFGAQGTDSAASGSARYFADWVVDQIPSYIGVVQDDIVVTTTLDPILQKSTDATISATLAREGELHRVKQGAALIMSDKGAIMAMVGGRDYGQSQFNRATQAMRPVGSAFKPFVYLSALERGVKDRESRIEDAPLAVGEYRPGNFDKEYKGMVTIEEAFTYSLNTPAVRLMKLVGINQVIATARKLGITAPLENDLSLALGSNGISMLEMTTAYASFSNGGYSLQPYGITEIKDGTGKLLYRYADFQNSPVRLVTDDSIYDLKMMMRRAVQEGTGQQANLPPYQVYGKTGTSQDFRDAWFIGFSENIVAAFWYGNDDNTPTKGVTGGNLPAQSFKSVISAYFQQTSREATDTGEDGSGVINRILRGLFND